MGTELVSDNRVDRVRHRRVVGRAAGLDQVFAHVPQSNWVRAQVGVPG